MTTPELPGVSWRKSSRSGGNNGACVEVGFAADNSRAVRDTKNRAGGYLVTTGSQWAAFLSALKAGRYEG
ncbi:DUF397 domain-containing protein [Saccharopolyspora sp. NFXS83]|uniref:DUF397 domain-containing protein n=1 Tax=Saccharopolyspora sp. NFXS83 TaxID=2993560 RepID=UPI00224B88FB|nr:DUF397 domain-containing protein [Saccharopolyspora sp. NFXS83]MCX2729459.1 DUF397 domain-containing protein [Saccharopolyspora sp. NFXS83]